MNHSTDEDGAEKEEESGDSPSGLMEKPFDPGLIKIETKTPSLDTLIRRIKDKRIQMDTSGYFQRKDDLWDKTKQSRLIESILIRFPLPAFFFDASDDNKWLIVDGLQRLSSIKNFMFKEQKLTNLEFLTDLNGKYWEKLPADLQRTIEETQVVIYKILPGTPSEVKFNIFKRINTGGLVLQSQEIRHALFQGKPSEFVKELADSEGFKVATGRTIKTHRMLDRDLANRFLAFYMLGAEKYGTKEYGYDLDTFMSKAMGAINHKKKEELDRIKGKFYEAMKLAKDVFGEEAFRKIRKNNKRLPPVNKALFDAISVQFALLGDEEAKLLKANKGKFKKQLNAEFEDEDFSKSISTATSNKKSVVYRHQKVRELIQDTIPVKSVKSVKKGDKVRTSSHTGIITKYYSNKKIDLDCKGKTFSISKDDILEVIKN